MPGPSTEKTIPVKVALRVRPLLPKEIGEGCQECLILTPGEPQVVMGNDKAFTFDHVYGSLAKQSDLYSQTVVPLLDGLFKGYNATVLAYGQTGSGKTYSMGTSFTSCTNTDDQEIQGVIPRVISDIFEYINRKKDETEFLLKCSFLEIHNEEIHDLLNPASSTDRIAIRENVEGGIKIAGLSELTISSGQEMLKCLCSGSASRATGATAMNLTSSRSHAIFSIIIEQKNKTGEGDFKRAKFHLVDLAGSERAKRTNAQGERFKEGVNINKGLLALGNVISALSDEQRKSNAHVPYRDSKLTRLLQDSLGGNSNTVMIACVSPADSNYEETLNTLRYADRARQIKNKPIVNRDPVAAEMLKLKQQVQMLQLQLLQGQTLNGDLTGVKSNETGFDTQEMIEHTKQLEEENLKLSQELHNFVNQNTTMYEKVLMAELARDRIVRQYDELKGYLTDQKVKLMPTLKAESLEETNLAAELQKKFHQFEESCTVTPTSEEHNDSQGSIDHDRSCQVESVEQDNNSLVSSPAMNSSFDSKHALRQAELGRQVQELTSALVLKQELAMKLQQNEGAMNEKMVKQYEVTVRELETEISKLEKEKSHLALALSAAKNSISDGNPKERTRIKELETQIVQLKKKQAELQKLQQLKHKGDATITKLNSEIQNMKSTRVKLMRQMKEEADKFRILKKEKEKEIMQLKQKDRKRQFEYSKLQNIHQKQQAVLKRKTEEAAAANRRLHEALTKRKEAAEKRENNRSIENKQSEGLVPRMKSWLSNEVEVLASISLAKKTLEDLIEDRKTVSQELSELRGQQESDEPPTKKRLSSMNEDGDSVGPSSEIQRKMNYLEAELKIKSSQIAELQRKLLDAESHVSVEKSKHRWNNIHTMAEAKAGLQVLLSMAVDGKFKSIKVEKDIEGDKKELEEVRSNTEVLITKHRKELEFLRADYDKRVTTLQKEHEDKVLLILQQLPTEEEKSELSSLRETLKNKDKELVEKHQENDMLQRRFAALSDALSNENSMMETSNSTKNPSKDEEEIGTGAGDEEAQRAKEAKIIYFDKEENGNINDDVEIDPDWVKTPKIQCAKKKVYAGDEEAQRAEEAKIIYFDESSEEENGDINDDVEIDPDWVETPKIQCAKKKVYTGCLCSGKCKRNCKCKHNSQQCGNGCRCKVTACCNRPKHPKTPVLFESLDSDLFTDKEAHFSPLTLKTTEKEIIKLSNGPNPKVTPTLLPKKSNISITNKPRGRENKLPSSSSSNKVRRKSGFLSKKQGVKSASSTVVTPRRAFLKSAITPSSSTKIPKIQLSKNNVDLKEKRKRKLHNPSTQLPPFV